MNPAMQSQYRQYSQTTPRPSHLSRRGPGPMVGGSQAQAVSSAAQLQARQEHQMKEAEAAKRRASRPTDRNMPEGIEDITVGDGIQQYRSLREVERKLDAVMTRKRLDLQEPRPPCYDRSKTLRVWISNTVENQPWQGRGLDEDAFDFNTGLDGTFKVKIEGRLLEDEPEDFKSDDGWDDDETGDKKDADNGDFDMAGANPDEPTKRSNLRPGQSRHKLAHFFKSIFVETDRNKNLHPDSISNVEWRKPAVARNTYSLPAGADFDSLEFERKGDENINCTINFVRDELPERFLLSKELVDILDIEEGTRDSVQLGIWDYIKAMNLQQDEEKRRIQCDDRLRALFKVDTIFFPQLTDLLMSHLSPLPPLKLPYTIRVDPEYHNSPLPTIYDIRVAGDDPVRQQMLTIVQNPRFTDTLRHIAGLDDDLADVVQALNHSKAKHAFFTSMSKDPATFVKRWTSSQKWDLEVLLGEAARGGGEDGLGEEFRKGGKDGIWGSEAVRESVGLMVARR